MIAWLTRRREITAAKHKVCLAHLNAQAALAPYAEKATIEWDLRWTRHSLDHTLKDEYLMGLWTVLSVLLLVPGVREPLRDGLILIHPDAPRYFLLGWAIIFAATFGVKQALSFVMPRRVTEMVSAMGAVKDDVPAKAVQDIVDDAKADEETPKVPG